MSLDPKNGKEYKCTISLKDANTMKLRGYIGFSVFGRTITGIALMIKNS